MDKILNNNNLKKILDNPLWYLCRSNTENAMSNFWAYLMEKNDNNLTIILGKKHKYGKVKKILREKNHMDLQIVCEKGTVVIENKFKSLADQKQIDNYKKKIQKQKSNYHFYLITPTGDKDFKSKNLTWMSYQDIYENIRKFKFTRQKTIIRKYLELLKSILNIQVNISKKNDLCQFWKTEEEIKDIVKKLKEEKLYAFIAKNLASKYQKKFKEIKGINLECGFSRSTPLMSWKKIGGDYIEGVQIQNGQFRLFVLSQDETKSISKQKLDQWIKTLQKEGLKVTSRKPYNKFGKCFKHKYFKITSKKHLEESLKKVFQYWEKQN